jgi:MYXO-CTERM domain-containing protein
VIDRRSISFEPGKEKKKEAVASEPEYDPKSDPNNAAYWAGGPTEAEAKKDKTLPPPAHLQEQPGSCAVTVGFDGSRAASALTLLALFALTARRSRRG